MFMFAFMLVFMFVFSMGTAMPLVFTSSISLVLAISVIASVFSVAEFFRIRCWVRKPVGVIFSELGWRSCIFATSQPNKIVVPEFFFDLKSVVEVFD